MTYDKADNTKYKGLKVFNKWSVLRLLKAHWWINNVKNNNIVFKNCMCYKLTLYIGYWVFLRTILPKIFPEGNLYYLSF